MALGKNFGEFLKYQRKRLGISQEKLADDLYMDRSYLSMLERKGNPTFQKMQEIIGALGLTFQEFFQTTEKEAIKPTIVLEGDLVAGKKIMEKHSLVIIPILASEKPLFTKVVTSPDIETYIMLDKTTLEGLQVEKLVAIRTPKSDTFKLILIDISAETLEDGESFLIANEHGAVLRKALRTKNGYIFESQDPEVKPEAYFGRQIDKVKILGKVGIVCATV